MVASSRHPARGLTEAEALFARDAAASGGRSAYASHGSPRMRFYRPDTAPAIGLNAALASPAMSGAKLAWTPEAIEASRAGDFGYVRGRYAAVMQSGAPIGVVPRNAIANRARTRPRTAGAARSCRTEFVTATNAALCQPKQALHKPASDGHDRTRQLWQKNHRREMFLDEAADLCRECHRLLKPALRRACCMIR